MIVYIYYIIIVAYCNGHCSLEVHKIAGTVNNSWSVSVKGTDDNKDLGFLYTWWMHVVTERNAPLAAHTLVAYGSSSARCLQSQQVCKVTTNSCLLRRLFHLCSHCELLFARRIYLEMTSVVCVQLENDVYGVCLAHFWLTCVRCLVWLSSCRRRLYMSHKDTAISVQMS